MDREELDTMITALEHCVTDCGDDCPMKDEAWKTAGFAACRAYDEEPVEVPAALIRRTVALLQAQEPRVLTLDEACNADCVWYDWRTRGVRPAKVNRVPHETGTYRIQRFGDIDEWNHADEYGEYWRCWTSRPTDAQRAAEPWPKEEP